MRLPGRPFFTMMNGSLMYDPKTGKYLNRTDLPLNAYELDAIPMTVLNGLMQGAAENLADSVESTMDRPVGLGAMVRADSVRPSGDGKLAQLFGASAFLGNFTAGMLQVPGAGGRLRGPSGVTRGKPRVVKSYDTLLREAQRAYPGKAGRIERHHVWPMYLGGPRNGHKVALDASYHQMITNDFRRAWPYGGRKPYPNELAEIMREVCRNFPLP